MDPVEQDFTADGAAWLATLAAMTAEAESFAAANRDAVASLAGLQGAIDAVHGKDVSLGVDVAGAAAAAEAQARLAQAVAATGAADAATAVAATAVAAAQDKQGAAAAAAATGLSAFQIGLYGGHVALTVFGAVLTSAVVGIIAFGISATASIAPVITSLSTLTTSYGQLDNYQKAAALSLKSFLGQFGGNQAGVFTVFNQALGLVQSHISATGGVTQQATIAFMDFFAMLQQQFASAGWASLFARQSGMVRSSLDALFGMINNLIGVIPALFHNFGFLGIGALNLMSGLLRLVAVVGNFDPALTRWAAGIATLAAAYHLLSNSIGFLPTFTEMFARTGLNAISATGALKNLREFGLIPTLSFMTGMTPAVMAATAGLAALGIAAVVLTNTLPGLNDGASQLISHLTAMDHATGDNAAGYARLAAQLQTATPQITLASRSILMNTEQQQQLTAAQQQAAATASALRANFAYLQQTYGLTAQQAYQLAQATGVNLKQGFTGAGTAAAETRAKIAAYEATVNNAAVVEKQFAYDMAQATNTSLGMVPRLQGLTAAFQVLSGATLQAMNAGAAFKRELGALQQAVRADGTETGYNTQKQAALTQALATVVQGAFAASTAILNNTHSAQAAAGPLITMRDEIRDLGLKGQAAAALIRQLNAEIAALHSKTITITTQFLTSTFAYHNPGSAAARQHGGPVMAGVPYLVGEAAPEVFIPPAAGRIQTLAQAQASGAGGSGPPPVTVNVYGSVIAAQDLKRLVQEALLDAWTRSHGTGLTPAGYGIR